MLRSWARRCHYYKLSLRLLFMLLAFNLSHNPDASETALMRRSPGMPAMATLLRELVAAESGEDDA